MEIYQNCLIFNDHAWDDVTDPDGKEDNVVLLEHGKPLIFGKNHDKGIRLNGLVPEVVSLGDGVTEADLLVHDESAPLPNLAYALSRMERPDYPIPLGVFRSVEKPTYAEMVVGQVEEAKRALGKGDLRKLYRATDTWEVSANGRNGHRA